jgi:guanylate kinase
MSPPAESPSGPSPAGPAPPGGDIFLVAAPSGAGKSSLVNALLARDAAIRLSVSFTTRPPRPGEVDGREYHFVDLGEFERRERQGEFLESAVVHGNHYGTSRHWIEQQSRQACDVLLEIDWQGASQIKRHFPRSVGIFVLPPSMDALQQRLRQRGQDPAPVIERRLQAARSEMSHAGDFDFVIVNEVFELALAELTDIVTATRLRFPAQSARHAALFERLGIARGA